MLKIILSAGLVIFLSAVVLAQDVEYINSMNLSGTPFGFSKAGDLVFIGRDLGLQIVSIADPAQPTEIGIYPGIFVHDFVVRGEYVYIAAFFDGLLIIDISDPRHPTLTGSLPCNYPVVYIDISGDYLYLTDNHSRMIVVDIQNPVEPDRLIEFPTNLYWPDIEVSGSYAYVASTDSYSNHPDSMKIIDISDQANPQLVSTLHVESINRICVDDNYVYAAARENGLVVIDISDPAGPYIIGEYHEYYDNTVDITTDGDYVYTASWSAMRIFDVSDPTNPDRIGGYLTREGCTRVFAADGYAIINAENSESYIRMVKILDVSDPTWVINLANLIMGYTGIVAASGDYVLFANGRNLNIVDMVDPAEPEYLGSCTLPQGGMDIVIEGDYAYIPAHYAPSVIVDISDPFDLEIVGVSEAYGEFISVWEGYAYITGHYGGLWVVDCADPANPVTVAHIDSTYHYLDVAARGDYAYVGGYSGVYIFDISAPSNPNLVGTFDTGTSINCLFISNDYLYLSGWTGNLTICSITDPAIPVFEGIFETSLGYVPDIFISGNYAYLVHEDDGLIIVDISDPANPVFAAGYDAYGHTIFVAGDHIFIGGGSLLWVLRFDAETGIVEEVDRIPRAFSLSQNYPNPFNPATTIEYTLPEASRITIEIYDILGRKVETLIQGEQPAGYHQITWDATAHSSGLYFYRIQAGEHIETRRIMLLK